MQIGPVALAVPVVLAPMAGITNQAYRRLCREQAERGLATVSGGRPGRPGLFVSEMVTSRALLERNPESLRLVAHGPGETPRSVQLYGVDPGTVGAAVRMLITEDLADHVDLNFGCPVPKVTRKGGGAALPWKLDLFGEIVAQAVRAADPAGVPVTVKMRTGIDAEHLTYLEAGRRAADEGVAALSLHGRTAADHYSPGADWAAIARLKEAVPSLPVLGNGDIWTPDDALRMIAETGCDGVVVGRGCLGRPWLFADLAKGFGGVAGWTAPTLGEVVVTMRRHLGLLIEHYTTAGGQRSAGADDVQHARQARLRACRDIRRHVAWYLKGYRVGQEVRSRLAQVGSVAEFEQIVATLEADQPYPGEVARGPRGRTGGARRVLLPDGWLDDRRLPSAPCTSAASFSAIDLTDDAAEVGQEQLPVPGG